MEVVSNLELEIVDREVNTTYGSIYKKPASLYGFLFCIPDKIRTRDIMLKRRAHLNYFIWPDEIQTQNK